MARRRGLFVNAPGRATTLVPVIPPRPPCSPRRRQILATRSAAVEPTPALSPIAPRPPVIRRRRALPEAVILRTRLEGLTPIEAAVLRALERCGRVTPRDIVRHVRGVEDAQAILNHLVELGLAARRPDDRRGPGRRAQWLYSVSTLLARIARWP